MTKWKTVSSHLSEEQYNKLVEALKDSKMSPCEFNKKLLNYIMASDKMIQKFIEAVKS
jgi:hypothetical protein